MPAWIKDLLQIERLFTIALIFFLVYVSVGAVRKNWKGLSRFVELVNMLVGADGEPGIGVRMDKQAEKLDAIAERQRVDSGDLTREVGELANVLERVRHQVENDHDTNFRDDQDKLIKSVEDLAEEFKAHVAISKAKDKEGDENAYRVAVLADKVNKIQPIVEQLGKTWGATSRNN